MILIFLIISFLVNIVSSNNNIDYNYNNSIEYYNNFTFIYKNNIWGNDKNIFYKGSSGYGSDIYYNINTYIPFLHTLFNDLEIKTVTDLGCGTFIFGDNIYKNFNITYYGYDIYLDVIEYLNNKYKYNQKYNFYYLDFLNNIDKLQENIDLCILKDVIQHWPTKDIYKFLDTISNSKKCKFLLIINCSNQIYNDEDIYRRF